MNLFQNTTSGFAELKNFYQGPLVNLINNDLPIYRAAEKVKEGWSGLQVVRSLRTIRNQGIGATSDGGNLPQIGRQTTVQATIQAKYNYLRFGVTAQMIKASQSDVGSFVRSAGYELEEGFKDLKSDINRQLSWNGRGDLALINVSANASTSIVIGGRTSTEPALKFLDIGAQFDLIDANANLLQSQITIQAITAGTASSATATLTCSVPVTATAGSILIRSGSNGNEIQGLFYTLDGQTTTVYGVNRAQALAYQGNVTDLTSSPNPVLSIDVMQTPFNEGLRRGAVNMYNAVFNDFTSQRYYQKLLVADKRYNNTTEGDGTFGSKGKFYMDFNGIPLVPDKDMPTRFAFLPAEVLKMYELCSMEFADETGSMYIAQTDVDAWEVRIRHYVNLFNEQPAACAVLQGYVSP